jgi:hypothetical protein
MGEPRWADGLLPDQPEWVRSLIEDEVDRRDKRIEELEEELESAYDWKAENAAAYKQQAAEIEERLIQIADETYAAKIWDGERHE